MAESIDILIQAEDKASTKFKAVGDSAEVLGRRVKETGGKVKSSVELAGTFANALGGTSFGGFAGEIGQITERIGAFSEVAKQGGAGALALKAGLVAATALVAVKVGETIGNWVWQTEKLAESMRKTAEEAQRLDQLTKSAQQEQFADKRQTFESFIDPTERQAAIKAREDELAKEKAGAELTVKLAERQVESAKKARDAWSLGALLRRGEKQAEVKNFEDELKRDQERLASIKNEWLAVQKLTSERAKEIEALKAANEAKAKSQSYIDGLREEVAMMKATTEERLKMEAAKNATPEQRGIAESLLQEREALKAKAEAEKEAQAKAEEARRQELSNAERIQDLQKKELARLQEKRILLTQGAEAARAFALEQQGLTKEAAAAIAAEETKLQQIEGSRKDALSPERQQVQAMESRLLTRGTVSDPVAANTAKIAQGQSDQIRALQDMIKQQQRIIDAVKENAIKVEMVRI